MPFVKGKSGNPSGRPKALIDVIALARSHTVSNIERIADLAANSEDDNIRLRASVALHEIAWGKPSQSVAVGGPDGGPLVVTWMEKPKE